MSVAALMRAVWTQRSPWCTFQHFGGSGQFTFILHRTYVRGFSCAAHTSAKNSLLPRLPVATPKHFLSTNSCSNNFSSLRVLYDGKCPICVREIMWLERRSRSVASARALSLVDISQPSYDSCSNLGITYEEAMKIMHVIREDGAIVKGVDAFEEIYKAVGLGWIFWALKIHTVRRVADFAYVYWAKYRMQITGRSPSEMTSTSCSTCRPNA